MSTPHSPEDVRDGLARCYLRHGADRPQWLADLAEPVVRLALEERDAEIERLRAQTITQAELEHALAELAVRTGNGNAYFPELGRNIFEYVKSSSEEGER